MILINFAHPISAKDLDDIKKMTKMQLEKTLEIPVQFDSDHSFIPQVKNLVDRTGISSTEWQTSQILVNPPSLNYIAAAVLAEIHGRAGYFPPIVRFRPVSDSLPPVFRVAEIINLQKIRDDARHSR